MKKDDCTGGYFCPVHPEVIVEYFRCEVWGRRIVMVDEENWSLFVQAIENAGAQVTQKEIPHPISFGIFDGSFAAKAQALDTPDACRSRTVIDSVYAVQGLERREGEAFLRVLESLVAEYARLK